jgi:hypothetical protein
MIMPILVKRSYGAFVHASAPEREDLFAGQCAGLCALMPPGADLGPLNCAEAQMAFPTRSRQAQATAG